MDSHVQWSIVQEQLAAVKTSSDAIEIPESASEDEEPRFETPQVKPFRFLSYSGGYYAKQRVEFNFRPVALSTHPSHVQGKIIYGNIECPLLYRQDTTRSMEQSNIITHF